MRRVHVVVSGRVQGVGYRFHAQREAERLSVRGWVRNCADGSVEAEVEGNHEAVAAMLDWLAEGPAGAWVRGVQTIDVQPRGGSRFEVRR